MNIKEILIAMKNRNVIDKFEGNYSFGSNIEELYLERITLKYFNTTEKNKIDDFIKKDKDKIKKINKKPRTINIFLILLGCLSVMVLLISNTNLNSSTKIFFGFISLLSILFVFFPLIYGMVETIKKELTKSIITKVDQKITKYIEDKFREFYKNITLDLIKEIELIHDTTLEKETNELKEYLIAKLYYYENNNINSNDKLKKLLKNKFFNDNKNYLENKILKIEDIKKEYLMINTEDEINKLKLSVKNKIPTI